MNWEDGRQNKVYNKNKLNNYCNAHSQKLQDDNVNVSKKHF